MGGFDFASTNSGAADITTVSKGMRKYPIESRGFVVGARLRCCTLLRCPFVNTYCTQNTTTTTTKWESLVLCAKGLTYDDKEVLGLG
jgi:hypothetical protein